MSARDAILDKIRSQIGGDENLAERRAAVANRLASAPKGIIPAHAQTTKDDQAQLFQKKAESVQATTDVVQSYDDIAEAVSAYLRSRNLPQKIKMGSDKRLEKAGWDQTPNLERNFGPAEEPDQVGLSHAQTGVAETGTLILTSGAENPTTLNFLPENHIIVINAADIEGDYETALARIRDAHAKGRLPRTVNMITGPSRSGDIEQTILLGAHGPRALHVIIVTQ